MNISFGMNIAKVNVTKKELSKHNTRKKYFKDKNKEINWQLTKYNKKFILENYDQLMDKHCRAYVKNYNKRQLQQGHKSRCKSVKDYYTQHGKNASRNVIFSIGTESARDRLENNILDEYNLSPEQRNNDKVALRTKLEPLALKNELIGFNHRHKHIKATIAYCHVDEGIIHCHAQLIALPSATHTKYKRPSFSFSKAVREEGHSKDGRKALSNIEAQEAPHAVQNLSKIMFHYPLHLVRTGNATTLSGKQYKHYAKMSDKAKNEHSMANSATSVARSASTAKSNALSDYKSLIASCYSVGYHDGSQSGSIDNSKSASTQASNAANLAYSSVSTSWASRSQDLDDREHHINNTASATNNLKNNLINAFKDEEDQKKLNSFNFHKVFRILIMWSKDMRRISKIVKKAKEKAHRIIANAKATANNFLRPNRYGERIMQNFIWKNKDCYPNVYQKDPNELHGKYLMKSFNDTAHNYHVFDSPEAQRENQQIQARGRDNGPTWGE